MLGHGAQAERGPSLLTSHLPLVSGVPDPGQCTPLRSVPAPLQDPSRNPSAELSGTLLLPHWAVSKLWGVQGELQGQGAVCCCVILLRKGGMG